MPIPSPPAYAELVLPLPLDQTFTYAVPDALRGRVAVGMRAVASLGGRVETGFIVALRADCALAQVKPLLDLPDEGPVIAPGLLQLTRWMADYYCCSWGEALQCVVPGGVRTVSRMTYHLCLEALGPGRFTERQRAVIAALHAKDGQTTRQLARQVGASALSNTLQALVKRGILRTELGFDEGVSIRTETWAVLCEAAVPDSEALTQLQRRAPKQAAVYLDLMHGQAARAASELCAKHGTSTTVLKELAGRGLIHLEEREFYRQPEHADLQQADVRHRLNPGQDAAYASIAAALEARAFQTFLLRGITGSGKTEIYLQCIERTLALGRSAIMLVPEISLTPQTVGRLLGRFQQDIAVLHSGLGSGERYDEWRRAQRGEVRIVVGARSAVFAPLPDVGLIIVDEEHDQSYKQSDTPRYHARDVAIMRAKHAGGVCVLGSATPSVESYFNAQRGKSTLLELNQRATAGHLPQVTLVDMRHEVRETSGQVVLSRALEAAVHDRIARKEQVILLLNRRGFAPFVLCPQCGWVAECENCQVSLTYHAHGAELRCHYCAAKVPKPEVCGACGFNPLLMLGTGTQKAEDYLLRSFPGARIERMDADTTAGKGGHAKILGRFAAGEIDILIGTQMLAKGHDYPGVTLVGVINADAGLGLPDFRAAEQAFQLLTQVAGRAGRGAVPGEVIVQTFRPRHYAIQTSARHDYAGFYAEEIQHREGASYPPFRRMAAIYVESEDPALAERHAFLLRGLARALIAEPGFSGAEILGPSPAVLRRINKKYRWTMALLSRSASRLNALTRRVRERYLSEHAVNAVQVKLDLDPYGMY